MSASFDTAVLFTLQNEGGEYTNEAADAGGPTRWGICLDDLSEYLGHKATASQVKALTENTAKLIYRKKYWLAGYEQLPQSVATAVFDWSVLHGLESARSMAQRAANELGAKLTVDGVFGPATIAALSELRPAYFIARFEADIKAYFQALVAHAPSQRVFLAGWLARANRYASLV